MVLDYVVFRTKRLAARIKFFQRESSTMIFVDSDVQLKSVGNRERLRQPLKSRMRSTNGTRSFYEVIKAMYSVSMVDRKISDCKEDFQRTRQPAKVII